MEKGFESLFQDQRIDPNSSSSPFGIRHRLIVPSFRDMLSPNPTNGNLPFSAFAPYEPRKASLPEEPRDWFYHQGFTPMVNSIPNNTAGAANGKKFLVFDQSNDQTTLIYSSDIKAAPILYNLPTWNNPKPQPTLERKMENTTSRVDEFTEEKDQSEMQEDTEELNALLYSDDEIDYSEDEEEMSTGHSPSSITGSDRRRERIDERDEEEVASSGPGKRRKRENEGSHDVILLEDTASSGNSGVNCSDDAELSSSGGGNGAVEEEFGGLPQLTGDRRSRKEKVRETISILQNLIPGEKNGKDAMVIIDEAIQYLRSLKVKVKALGLDSL